MITGNLSNIFCNLARGGLFQVTSPRGGATQFFLSRAGVFEGYCLWISDEAMLYPPALLCRSSIPLSRWCFVRVEAPKEAWRVGLEATYTGLFQWILVRPSQTCSPAHLRRLQIAAERARTKILVLGNLKIPHWVLTLSLEIDREAQDETYPLSSQFFICHPAGRGMFFAHAEGQRL